MKETIGDRITKLRNNGLGMTQSALAERLQVSDKTVSKWENNKGEPSIEFLPKLAEIFECTTDYLLTGKENDRYYDKTVYWLKMYLEHVFTGDVFSTTVLQKSCRIGFTKSGQILDKLDQLGLVTPSGGTVKARKIIEGKKDEAIKEIVKMLIGDKI